MIRYLYTCLLGLFLLILSGCGGSSASDSPSGATATPSTPTPLISPTPTPVPGPTVTVSGRVTYDVVPHLNNGGLDYGNMSQKPVRGATVALVASGGTVRLAEGVTDDDGRYSIDVAENRSVAVSVFAELAQSGTPSWQFRVTDNTQSNALYVMQGSVFNSGTSATTVDLHADSGWNGSNYAAARVAAPFAILDSVYEALGVVLAADANVVLGPAELRWSVNNRATPGSRSDGNIGTSFYDPNENNMYILGDANGDTDEYDKSVIQHELAHYLEDTISRSDSPGGQHTFTASLDMRLAFGEGFANAFSGIASNQPLYSDSAGIGQQLGFQFSLEANSTSNSGWFNENSIGKVIFDIADSDDDGVDNLSLGFEPIYTAMTGADYTGSVAMTSIFLLMDELRGLVDDTDRNAINAILIDEDINGTGAFGVGETNDSDGSISFALPVYNTLNVGDTISVCSNNRDSEYNRLDNRRFVRVNVTSAGQYDILLSKNLGTGDRQPEAVLWRRGATVDIISSSTPDTASSRSTLVADEYILEVYDRLNIDGNSGGGSSCFDVSVMPA